MDELVALATHGIEQLIRIQQSVIGAAANGKSV
jgi:hypothetical protein